MGGGASTLKRKAIKACDDGDASALESLLKAGASPNAAGRDGWTPLLSALLEGHTECVRLLLASPVIDVNQANKNGYTPLFIAVQKGLAECVRLLLASPSVDVNQANNEGATPLSFAAQKGQAECMRLLLASPSVDVNQASKDGFTPLYMAAQKGQAECMRLLLASPSIAVNQARNGGTTPLIVACASRSTAAVLTLLADERTELDTKNSRGDSALSCAAKGDNAQLVAALIARGADPLAAFPNPVVADCVVGRALEARARLERQPQAADDALPELTRLCLVGTSAQVKACKQSKTACEAIGAMPPPLATAIEVMHARGDEGEAIVSSLLRVTEGVKNEEQRDALLGAARTAAAAAAAVSTAAYVAGTAYHAFVVACVDAGLIDERSCGAAKKLVLAYIGSIAASSHMAAVGGAFDGLKTACTRRLERIAAPLDALCEREELCSRLGSIGASIGNPPVALDDALLLPMPKRFHGAYAAERAYEPYLIELIYMVSLALDDLFVDKLRKALMRFGDGRVAKLDDGKGTLRISKGGVPQIDITRAPVKLCRQHTLCVRPFALSQVSLATTRARASACHAGEIACAHAEQARERRRPSRQAAAAPQVERGYGAGGDHCARRCAARAGVRRDRGEGWHLPSREERVC